MTTLKKCNHEDTNSDSDSEHEYYCMEDVSLDLKDVNVREILALSNLHRPPQNVKEINQMTPMTIMLVNTWLGKSR